MFLEEIQLVLSYIIQTSIDWSQIPFKTINYCNFKHHFKIINLTHNVDFFEKDCTHLVLF